MWSVVNRKLFVFLALRIKVVFGKAKKIFFPLSSFLNGEWGPGIPSRYLWYSVTLLFAEMKAFVNEFWFLGVIKMCVN